MRKILLLLLSIGFFTKPMLAQDGTASASAQVICPGTHVFLYYTGGTPNSVWELQDPQTGTWGSFASAAQAVDLTGLLNPQPFQSYVFRVKSPDGDTYLLSNEVTVQTSGALSGVLPGISASSFQYCPGDNTTTTLEFQDPGADNLEPYTNIHWGTGKLHLP